MGFFEGFGPCLGISHPTHPHLGKISQKKPFFLVAPLMSLLSFCCCQPLTSVSNQRCWCHGDLCNNPSNDTFVFSHTTTTTRATTAKTTERKTDATQEVEKTTEKQTTSKARNSRNQNFNAKKGISVFSIN